MLASAVVALALLAAASLLGHGGVLRAAAQASSGEPTPQTDDSVPAIRVRMIGASPREAPNETWGVGQLGEGGPTAIVRYSSEAGRAGWSLGPRLLDPEGKPLTGFKLDSSPLAGQMSPNGSGVLIGELPPAASSEEAGPPPPQEAVLVRNPGGAFQQTAPLPEGETALQSGEGLYTLASRRAPLLAPLEESPSTAGALVVPVKKSGVESSVLHWDGHAWTREPIEVPEASNKDLRVLAIGASSPSNAWLLAELSATGPYPAGAVALFRRVVGEGGKGASWRPVALSAGPGDGEAHPLTVPLGEGSVGPFTVHGTGEPPTVEAQILTVTSDGVWIDGERPDAGSTEEPASTTLFFKPEGSLGGTVISDWCRIPAGAPSGTRACRHELSEALPTGPSRSIAWANSSTPEGLGERVIAGFPEGVSLRLDGTSFTRVLALGGGETSFPGSTYGAAFSNPREGWLGEQGLPVHLTREPAPSRLTPWPVSFRHALLAVAPQPGAPVGSLSSEALAVGDQGEVARYMPGEGWLPESLIGVSGRHETPLLRAVAWPTAGRAYAVGDAGTMWLWRGETGLWEPDPATPYNFRGNLMGIAFDPANPSRGYAVGESGVLLRYGKTWTQEEALPAGVAGASFTSIAFAGSEAIVTYRKLLNPQSVSSYVGGLLVNDGSGWRIDEGAAAAMGSAYPSVVAGLADGGAAFVAKSPTAGATVFERESASAGWQPVGTPFPGALPPASLSIFREGGAVRVVSSGTEAGGFEAEGVLPSPPGTPPPLVGPYGLGSNSESGVLRQTAHGWSDEQHELNNAREPVGKYRFYDTVYQPDPVAAVLIDPTGTQGWAVGGFLNRSEALLETADIERYPADGVTPTGLAASPVSANPSMATFAIGGGSQCAAPCADRANARIGPDVWLSSALAHAAAIPGVRAFLDTGPRRTTGETEGAAASALPYERELDRYSGILAASPISAFVAPSSTDLDGSGSEATFDSAFSGAPQAHAEARCSGSQSACYAFNSEGSAGTVRVIVLDDTADVGSTQLAWLAGELQGAKESGHPAIVLGNADLGAQVAAHDSAAEAVVRTLVGLGVGEDSTKGAMASAYFFDSPEQNVKRPLRLGGASIESFGSGTLGYVNFVGPNGETSGAFLGASGFLLVEVEVAGRNANTNLAPVVPPRLIPNIGELAIEPEDGTLLHRSQPALFQALARRPRAGNRSPLGGEVKPDTDPYIPIPSYCVGAVCNGRLAPEYTFSSSRPDIGDFVAPNPASADPKAVLLGSNEQPIHDSASGLFCAYNAGTTIVTISSGGLSSSLPVTVQAGSVRRPCGTQPLKELPSEKTSVAAPPPPPPPATAPGGAAPASSPPPIVPLPPVPVVPPAASVPPHPAAVVVPPFLVPAALTPSLLPFVPLPPPSPARPTPPSGTSAVTSPVEAPQREEEEEEATESVSNQAVAYRAPEHEPVSPYVLGIVVLAAFAGAAARRPRRGGRDVRLATVTLNTSRSQRRMSGGGRRIP